jgi:hypothetical protein
MGHAARITREARNEDGVAVEPDRVGGNGSKVFPSCTRMGRADARGGGEHLRAIWRGGGRGRPPRAPAPPPPPRPTRAAVRRRREESRRALHKMAQMRVIRNPHGRARALLAAMQRHTQRHIPPHPPSY